MHGRRRIELPGFSYISHGIEERIFMKRQVSLWGIGVVSAIAASLCCIMPVIAFLAGVGGIASVFAWIEPIRPYLILFTLLSLGAAWFVKFRSHQQTNCACEDKPGFLQSKMFLSIVTVFAVAMLTFPYYSFLFFTNNESRSVAIKESDLTAVELSIEGMTCSGCEEHIVHTVRQLDGIAHVEASYKSGHALIKCDQSKMSLKIIADAINATGYRVASAQLR